MSHMKIGTSPSVVRGGHCPSVDNVLIMDMEGRRLRKAGKVQWRVWIQKCSDLIFFFENISKISFHSLQSFITGIAS